MIVVGIDPSVKATGVVVSKVTDGSIEVLCTKCLSYSLPGRSLGQGLRQRHVIQAAMNVVNYIDEKIPVYYRRNCKVAIEDFAYGRTSSVSYDLGMFGGILREELIGLGFEVYLVPVAGSKSFISGRRITSEVGKQEARDFADSFGVLEGVVGKFRQEAVSDAWAALCTFLRSFDDSFFTERRKSVVERLEF